MLDVAYVDSPILLTLKYCGNMNIDLSSLLLTKEGLISEEGNFVFYNSKFRTKPFDRKQFRNISHWRESTSPISADGAVEVISDEILRDSCDISDYCIECMMVTLSKIRNDIDRIIFTVSGYYFDTYHNFGNLTECIVEIFDKQSMRLLTSCNLLPIIGKYQDNNAIVFCELSRRGKQSWHIKFLYEAYKGGLGQIINTYS